MTHTLSLVFHTPSMRCPFRKHNGRAVVVTQVLGRHRTRTRGIQRMYGVRIVGPPNGEGWIAFGDELHLERR